MKSLTFPIIIGIIIVQFTLIWSLLFKIKGKLENTLGVSVNRINPKTIQFNPKGGLSNYYEPISSSIVEENMSWLPHKVVYTINIDTLNERFDYQEKKEKKIFRIITLGDSFTYGLHVSTPDNWTELLEEKLNSAHKCGGVNRYEVINLGMQGYDIEYGVERYKIRGRKYNPDLVIWYVRNLSRITNEIKEIAKTLPPDDIESSKVAAATGAWEEGQSNIINTYGENQLMKFQLNKLQYFRTNYYHGPLLIFTRNKYMHILESFSDDKIYLMNQSTELEFNKKFQVEDSHYNEIGNIKMMKEILEYMINHKLIPCKA